MACEENTKCRTILVAVDEGEHSMYALRWALNFLSIGRFPNDRAIILYVKPSHANLSGPAFVLTAEAVNSLERYDESVLMDVKTTVQNMCDERKSERKTIQSIPLSTQQFIRCQFQYVSLGADVTCEQVISCIIVSECLLQLSSTICDFVSMFCQ
ncbi:hypothetical protein KP509_07G000800 [Ceratopteris richardii]|uniref:UspA domain-containing protein n=1 Tax=Ceratopteris richardii TaxID=49495 RepID=A0A8T2U810_CERRI|nr:hypothetical protein KP509_07G000800 [Ceratopteris richardii]